uniref:Trichohyalin-like n=2 Tax=Cacopsylla melanoneura TaxID=428564 RepID=A0A8D8SH69_9HEMI
MTSFFLTLFLLSSINNLKANVHPKDFQLSIREVKKENETVVGDVQMATECLHRIRRDNNLQNEIKKRKKTGSKWSDKRKQEHTKFMKKHWKNKKEERGHNRRKEHGHLMRTYWKKYKEKGNTHKVSRKMIEYWKRHKEDGGITERLKQHSKKMKAYWQKQNADSRKKRGERLKNVWRNQDDKLRKHSEKLKEYWRNQREQGGNNKNKLLSEKKKEYWRRRRKELGCNNTIQEMEKRKRQQRKKIKKKKMLEKRSKNMQKKEIEGTTKRLSLKERMDAYWKKIREEENNDKEKHSVRNIRLEVTTRLKSLKERIDEFWRKQREEENRHKHKTILSEKQNNNFRKVQIEGITKRKTRKGRMDEYRNKQRKEKASSNTQVFGDKYKKTYQRKNSKAVERKKTFRRWKTKIEMTTKRKSLKERMDEYWKNIREEEKRNTVENIGNRKIYFKKPHEDGKIQSLNERMQTRQREDENKELDYNKREHLRKTKIEEPKNMKAQYDPTGKAFPFNKSLAKSSIETSKVWNNEKERGNTQTNKVPSDEDKRKMKAPEDLEIKGEFESTERTTAKINWYYDPAGPAFEMWRNLQKNSMSTEFSDRITTEFSDEDYEE